MLIRYNDSKSRFFVREVVSVMFSPTKSSLIIFLLLVCTFLPGLPTHPGTKCAARPQSTGETAGTVVVEEQPANYVVLTWEQILPAVQYELELSQHAATDNSAPLPDSPATRRLQGIFVNGAILDLRDWPTRRLFFRARPLDRSGQPLGPYTYAKRVRLNHHATAPLRPVLQGDIYETGLPGMLYPTYSWLPVPGASGYELEITSAPPASPTTLDPDPHRIYATLIHQNNIEFYDWEPKRTPGTYYWRVRALDEDDDPLGLWSEPKSFIVDTTPGGIAAYGDSITHGGGGLSYGPSEAAFSYLHYLSFPCINLARSGDTSETMLERFDRDVLPFSPKYLLILGGTNSLRGGAPADQVIKELFQLGEKCRQNNIRPIYLTLPPINPDNIQAAFQEGTVDDWQTRFNAVNTFIRRQRYYIDIAPPLTDKNGLLPTHLSLDGIHPDAPAKQIMGDVINRNWPRVTR